MWELCFYTILLLPMEYWSQCTPGCYQFQAGQASFFRCVSYLHNIREQHIDVGYLFSENVK